MPVRRGSSTATDETNSREPLVASVGSAWFATGDPSRDLPSWVAAMVANGAQVASSSAPCDQLTGERLSSLSRDTVMSALGGLTGSPCRMWAFLPRLTDSDGDLLQRYMRFNAGRTDAFRAASEQIRVIPAGTCVGHGGSHLVVHALRVDAPFRAIENPRQRSAFLYSSRFGPVPPAFTRGVVLSNLLLAAGTAAVVGEESMHEDSLDAQFEESVRNLDSLAEVAGAKGSYRSMQIYVRDSSDMERVRQLATKQFGSGLERILRAPICRHELRLEIEGVCDVD